MRKLISLTIVFLLSTSFVHGQKLGYIDSQFILSKMPEYAAADKALSELTAAWDKEVRDLYNEVEVMRAKLRTEEALLSKGMKEDRQAAIDQKEKEALEKNTELFGFEGLYFKKQQELLQPLRTRLFEAVEVVAKKQKIGFMFDKAADIGLIYSDPVHDYTEFVLEELGLGVLRDQLPAVRHSRRIHPEQGIARPGSGPRCH